MHDKTQTTLDPFVIHALRHEFNFVLSCYRAGQPLPWRAAELLGLLDRWGLTPQRTMSDSFVAPFHEDGRVTIRLCDAVDRVINALAEATVVDGSALGLRSSDSVTRSCEAFTAMDAYFAGTSMVIRSNRTRSLEAPDLTAMMTASRRITDVLAQDVPLRAALGCHAGNVLRDAPPKEYDPMLSVYVKLLGYAS